MTIIFIVVVVDGSFVEIFLTRNNAVDRGETRSDSENIQNILIMFRKLWELAENILAILRYFRGETLRFWVINQNNDELDKKR